MTSLNASGTTFEYVERGAGDTVVFVHGSASDLRTWQKQLPEFSKHFRVVAYSRRYHWPNKRIPEGADYSMVEQVDDLRAILHSLNLAPVHLVGHSYGAFLCLLLAIRDPGTVRTLVLAEPPVLPLLASNSPRPSEILKLMLTNPRAALAVIKFGAGGLAPAKAAIKRNDVEKAVRCFGAATLGRKTFHHLSEARLEQVRANFIKAELMGSGFAPLDEKQLNSIQIPTLLLTAQDSRRLFHHFSDRLEKLLPDVERAAIPAASHIMHEDNPGVYNSIVLSFLSRHRSAKG